MPETDCPGWLTRLARIIEGLAEPQWDVPRLMKLLDELDDAMRLPLGEYFRAPDRPSWLPLVDGHVDPHLAAVLSEVMKPFTARTYAEVGVRQRIARLARLLARITDGAPRIFLTFPQIERFVRVTGRRSRTLGRIGPSYGTSIYDSHVEFPVDGIGRRKDHLLVVLDAGEAVPLTPWLREHHIIVTCQRCGCDVTDPSRERCRAPQLGRSERRA